MSVRVPTDKQAETSMAAPDILAAIRNRYPEAAIVPELVIRVEDQQPDNPKIRRIDALMFDGLQRTAIEVKTSRTDANRETWEKVHPWRRVTHRFVYAVPAGLIDKPPLWGPGLWWVHDDGKIEVKRKCQINKYPEPLPQQVVANIAWRASKGMEALPVWNEQETEGLQALLDPFLVDPPCERCGGCGHDPGSMHSACSRCGGRGCEPKESE